MIRNIRMLRLKHGISFVELSRVCGISTQRLSQIELNPHESTQHHKELMRSALQEIAASRKEAAADLEADLAAYGDRLLDFGGKEPPR